MNESFPLDQCYPSVFVRTFIYLGKRTMIRKNGRLIQENMLLLNHIRLVTEPNILLLLIDLVA